MKKISKRGCEKPFAKRLPGSTPRDPSGRQQSCTVFLCPAEKQFLTETYGSVNGGLRKIVLHLMAEAEAKKPRK